MVLRVFLLLGWLFAGGAALAYHYGPGQDQSRLDAAAKLADASAASADPADAVDDLNAALAALPAGRTAEARVLRLAKAKAIMSAKQLPEANADLQTLVDELAADPAADATVLTEARDALANSQYYVTWLMRLEAAVRLARMDLPDLQAKNLPKQCKGCCSCKSSHASKNPVAEKREDARGASGAQPLDDGGH